jgi:O-antigen ligase
MYGQRQVFSMRKLTTQDFCFKAVIALWVSLLLNPSAAVHLIMALIILFLGVPWVIWQQRSTLDIWRKPTMALVCLGAFIISGLAVSTFYAPANVIFKPLSYSLQTAAFLVLSYQFWQQTTTAQQHKLIKIILGAATLCCLISLPLFFIKPPTDNRLMWIGQAGHPIMGGLLFAQIAFMSLWQAKTQKPQRWFYVAIAALIFVCIYLTKSRSVYMACWVAGLYIAHHMLAHKKDRLLWRLLLVAWLSVTVFVIYSLCINPAWLVKLFDILHIDQQILVRDSYRIGVWHKAIEVIPHHWIFGHGWKATFPYFAHPHNWVLSTLYYQGIVGFVLFLGFLGAIFGRSGKKLWQPIYTPLATALILTATVGMADFAHFIDSVSILWFTIWWPLMRVYYVGHHTQQA